MAKQILAKRVVGQTNSLVRDTIYSSLSVNALKVFKAIISKVNYNDSLFEDYYILDYSELNMIGLTKSNRFVVVTSILEELASTWVPLKISDNKYKKLGLIMNIYKYEVGTSFIEFKVHDDLKPFLLELKEKYTKYELLNIKKLNTVPTLKLYELFKSWQAKGSFAITLDSLKKYLELDSSKYHTYSSFKQAILTKCINKINANTDVNITYKEVLKGRAVNSITFNINKVVVNNEKVIGVLKPITDDFSPDDSSVQYCIAKNVVDIEAAVKMFKEHYIATQETFTDPQPAFKRFVLNGINKYQSIDTTN